ncbi:MAG: D-alanyl-D-alanine carboxypeptidase family protein [Kiritimatiellia bacterium]|jgi:D-alanyl-D-alanine carboxypeptidase (penicillin-binding protein 5/6)
MHIQLPSTFRYAVFGLICLLSTGLTDTSYAARAQIETRVGTPYLGAIVTDADTGMILFEDRSDVPGYPASTLKVMDLMLVLQAIQAGTLKPDDPVRVTAEAARIGGSQVYLKENESFTVDELLYALMVQSANDAATALAIHIAGSKDGFVAMMNKQAQSLRMRSTQFHSVHGLPPADGQQPDISTARDLAYLARAVLAYPETLRYTSTTERTFREQPPFIMRNHNRLLFTFEGCDGIKTGYFRQAGYSIITTAKRGDTRIIAVLLGCPDKKTRDDKAAELLALGFAKAPKKPAPPPIVTPTLSLDDELAAIESAESRQPKRWIGILITVVVVTLAVGAWAILARRRKLADPD